MMFLVLAGGQSYESFFLWEMEEPNSDPSVPFFPSQDHGGSHCSLPRCLPESGRPGNQLSR